MRAALLLCCALASLAIVAGATCPSSGIICTSQCSTTFQQCTSSQTYPAQAVAPGTVCCNGAFVYPNDPCCSGATTAAPTTTRAPATSAPTTKAPTTAASTTKAPTTQAATTTSGTSTLSQIFTQADWNTLFPNANLAANRGDAGQYPIFTYSNLINAAAAYPAFASVGTTAQRKRELAAFLAQTSQETSGWWSGQDYIWGYVYSTELCGANCNVYCGSSTDYPCVSGQNYNGRGPIQISWNYNYGPASAAILGNKNTLLNNPNLVLTDGVVAYKTALWFWMTTQSPKPSCHDVMTGAYTPTAADTSAGRVAGFGLVTDIINGGIECNTGATPSPQSVNRVGYYNKYTNYFGVSDTSNLYCNNMKSY